jgi:hypothetical protein
LVARRTGPDFCPSSCMAAKREAASGCGAGAIGSPRPHKPPGGFGGVRVNPSEFAPAVIACRTESMGTAVIAIGSSPDWPIVWMMYCLSGADDRFAAKNSLPIDSLVNASQDFPLVRPECRFPTISYDRPALGNHRDPKSCASGTQLRRHRNGPPFLVRWRDPTPTAADAILRSASQSWLVATTSRPRRFVT